MIGSSNTATANPASVTTTTTSAPAVLRLRPVQDNEAAETRDQTKVQKKTKSKSKTKNSSGVRWTDDVIDNEHMDKKKSKICCIFHPQREFGEVSDSSSSSSSDSSDTDSDSEAEHSHHGHSHGPEEGSDRGHLHEHSHANGSCSHEKSSNMSQKARKGNAKPNAYERQPDYRKKPANVKGDS